jgi:cyclic beta-1,2-glucan synthetase
MQRAGIEGILGLRFQGKFLRLDPCIPKDWPSFEMTVRYRTARYEIKVENPNDVSGGVLSATLDGAAVTERPLRWPLLDDARVHHVQVTLGVSAVPGAGKERGDRQSAGAL